VRYPHALTTTQAANLLDCSPGHVYVLARAGKITGSKHGGRWYFDTESVLNYGIRGRPLPPRIWKVTPERGPARTYATPHTAALRAHDLLDHAVPVTVYRATLLTPALIDPVTGYQIPQGASQYRVHQRIRPTRPGGDVSKYGDAETTAAYRRMIEDDQLELLMHKQHIRSSAIVAAASYLTGWSISPHTMCHMADLLVRYIETGTLPDPDVTLEP
jgi:excisionase family DNA binding protein